MKKSDLLRERAEEKIQNAKIKEQIPESNNELVHELQVHQAELEMQNEELRKSQEELSRLYNKYYDLYNDVPVGYFTLDNNGIIRNVNFKGTELLQLDKEMIIGRGFSQFIPKVDENKYFHALANAIDKGKNQELELQLKRDKTLFDAHMEILPLFDRDNSRYRIIITDITELKKAENALKHARDYLEEQVEERTAELKLASLYNRSLIEASLDPLVTIGPDGKITDVNTATELDTGYSKEELIGTNFSNYFTEPQKAELVYKMVFKEGKVRDYPLEIKHRNGHITPVLYNASVYKDESGEVMGVFAAARDTTELKKAEEELKESINELRHSNEELESFAYITSHDLQEPLRSIASYAQLIERRYKGQLDNDADEFLEFMVNGATRMKEQIQGLLDYSRTGTHGEEFKDFNAGEALNKALSNLKSSIDECHAEVTYDSLPIITADENQITQVFQNLIGNAIKFHKEGIKPKIHISSYKTKDGKGQVFSVKDSGIGIEEHYVDHIFEVFKRLHAIGEYKGAGIGLAIVKRIVERHGGRVWVDSEIGVGSTFYFTIPVSV